LEVWETILIASQHLQTRTFAKNDKFKLRYHV